jgi:hypothetical protein
MKQVTACLALSGSFNSSDRAVRVKVFRIPRREVGAPQIVDTRCLAGGLEISGRFWADDAQRQKTIVFYMDSGWCNRCIFILDPWDKKDT